MSHHSTRRVDDRNQSHSSHRYEKYEQRHRLDDSRDRDYYHSKKSSRRDKYRSRSRSPSHGSKSYSRHHRNSRSRSPPGYSSSRHHDDYHRTQHRSKDYKDLSESKSRHDSREHSQSKHNTISHEVFDINGSVDKQNIKYEDVAINNMMPGQMTLTSQTNENSPNNECEQPKTISYNPNDPDAVLEEEKQRIQRETLERLQKHLEAEGKAYPPKKPQASHPIFANDGSFLEMFKSMQGNLQQHNQLQQQPQLIQQSQNINGVVPMLQPAKPVVPTTSAAKPINRIQPINRRRGAKILKTGIVQKQRVIEETDEATAASNDSWNAYLKEVKRYKTVTCSDENMTRSLVK